MFVIFSVSNGDIWPYDKNNTCVVIEILVLTAQLLHSRLTCNIYCVITCGTETWLLFYTGFSQTLESWASYGI